MEEHFQKSHENHIKKQNLNIQWLILQTYPTVTGHELQGGHKQDLIKYLIYPLMQHSSVRREYQLKEFYFNDRRELDR